jgi:CHAD domain-containing protein
MARARAVPGLGPDTPFAAAAAAVVEVRTTEVFAHSAGVLDTVDIERVHAMRVATRRLRSALEVFAVCFPRKRHRRALQDVKRLADALGERRDPDVAIAALRDVRSELQQPDHAGIDSLVAEFRDDQRNGNERLAAALEEARESRLEQRLLELAAAARPEPEPEPEAPPEEAAE